MLKVGVVGFGGGSALVPVMEKELVREGLLRPSEFTQDTVIANITPGALPVKLAALSGARVGGARRATALAFAVALPGALGTVALLALIAQLGPNAIGAIEFASLGITAFILYLLAHYVMRVVAPEGLPRVLPIVIAVVAFVLTGAGKTVALLHDMVGLEATWSVSELSALGLVLAALVAIAVVTGWQRRSRHASPESSDDAGRAGQTSRALRSVAALSVITAVGLLASLLVTPLATLLPFMGLILASTVTSFGGGEAYVGVADGYFVASGLVNDEIFYGQVVPIANALPGPILVKIAAGVSFLVGGWPLATAALLVTVASCSALAVGALAGYNRARNSLLIRNISTFILPVVCGLLASTAVSMLHSNARIGADAGVLPVVTVLLSVLAAALVPLLQKTGKVPDIVVIIAYGAISWGALTLVASL